MITFKKILVPVDFSENSRKAIDMAVEIARRFDATLDLLHVVEYPVYMVPEMTVTVPGAPIQTFEAYAEQNADRDMKKLISSLSADGAAGVRLGSKLMRGEAARTIVSAAKDEHYDLIVMGTHGRTGLDHMLLGSVAERVLRKAPCAVLTTREFKSSSQS